MLRESIAVGPEPIHYEGHQKEVSIEEVRIMSNLTNNPNEPRKLDDDDLAAVSGGEISIAIMDLVKVLPESSQTFVLSILDGTIEGESRFLNALELDLRLHGKDHEAAIIRAHRKYYWDRTFLNGNK